MARDSSAAELARECVAARLERRKAGRILHDGIASMLAVAGLRLQLLQMDFPDAAERAADVANALEAAVEQLRALSHQLEPTPVRRTGLKNALLDLSESYAGRGIRVSVKYGVTVALAPEIADAFYLAAAAVAEKFAGATESASKNARRGGRTSIMISAAGSRKITVRIARKGAWPGNAHRIIRELEPARLLARAAGLDFDVRAEKGTIVSIQYVHQRSSRR